MSKQPDSDSPESFFDLAVIADGSYVDSVPGVEEHVRYLSHALTPSDEEGFLVAITRHSESRRELVTVQGLLSHLQSLPWVQVVQRSREEGVEGMVARAWMGVLLDLFRANLALKLSGAKIHLQELAQADFKLTNHLRNLFVACHPPQMVAPAIYRSGPEPADLNIEAFLDQNGDLAVHLTVSPARLEDWENRTVEVSLKVQVPVVVGVGKVQNGRLELVVPQAGQVLGRPIGPIDPSELTVAESGGGSGDLVMQPIDYEEAGIEHPRLVDFPIFENGSLKATMIAPSSFRSAYVDCELEIYLSLQSGQHQKLAEVRLLEGQEVYTIEMVWPDSPFMSGRVPLCLRYRIARH